jgi:hypothetical protein
MAAEITAGGAMTPSLIVETGDVTSPDNERRTYQITATRPPTEIVIAISDKTARVQLDAWLLLVQQI